MTVACFVPCHFSLNRVSFPRLATVAGNPVCTDPAPCPVASQNQEARPHAFTCPEAPSHLHPAGTRAKLKSETRLSHFCTCPMVPNWPSPHLTSRAAQYPAPTCQQPGRLHHLRDNQTQHDTRQIAPGGFVCTQNK